MDFDRLKELGSCKEPQKSSSIAEKALGADMKAFFEYSAAEWHSYRAVSDRLYTEFGIAPIKLPSTCCRNNVKCIM